MRMFFCLNPSAALLVLILPNQRLYLVGEA